MTTKQWVYLTDLAPSATIQNLSTGETRRVMSNAVIDRAPSGLRRTVLEELDGGMLRETSTVLPMDAELAESMDEHYEQHNSWIYDWPHLPTESAETPEARAALEALIYAQMGEVPFTFKITAMQRRYLMYFSDGSLGSQKRFERFIPQPSTSPFSRNWELKPRYEMYYNSIMRDANVPLPKEKMSKWGSGRPCLYVGPAWTVRFTIDDQDPLLERCSVYITDDGTLIGTAWCQRNDQTSYQSGGINLQMGIYTLSSWIMGPCLTYNQTHGGIKLRHTEYKRDKVSDLLKKSPMVAVPDFDDSFAKAQALIKQYAPVIAASAAPAVADAGPITPDVMAEAIAASEVAIEAMRLKRNSLTPETATPERSTDRRVPDFPWTSEFIGEENGWYTYNAIKPVYYGCPTYAYARQDDGVIAVLTDSGGVEHFKLSDDSSSDFMYCGDEKDFESDQELSTDWWLYAAAVYYRDVLLPRQTQVLNILMEAL